MNESQEVLNTLKKVEAIITNSHIVYTSGKHGNTYINEDMIYLHTEEISKLCQLIAQKFVDDNVEVVIAPAIRGVILSQWVAYHLTKITGKEVLSVYAEKSNDGDTFIIKRGYDKFVTGKNVLVVEDVLTTGDSARKVVEATRSIGGNVIGLGVLCNRGYVTPHDVADVPRLCELLKIHLNDWEEDKCPLCAENVPINTNVGEGRQYLDRKEKEKEKK